MNKSFSLLFYVKSSKMSADGTAPIYLRHLARYFNLPKSQRGINPTFQ
jgi:hypothetical protein